MSFVVIVEPNEIHAASIRAILDGVETNFEYGLVTTAEAAIDMVERQKPDVFIGEMQMPVMSGEELFAMVEMISPETIRVVMSDGGEIEKTIDFINECKIFKIIIKPCRLAEDLLVPINAALEQKESRKVKEVENQKLEAQIDAVKQSYAKTEAEWNRVIDSYGRAKQILVRLLEFNTELAQYDEKTEECLRKWYAWMVEQYIKTNLAGAHDSYAKIEKKLTDYGADEMNGQAFQMKNICREPIQSEQLNEIAYILMLCIGYCKAVFKRYDAKVRIEDAQKAFILRMRCTLFRDWTKEDKPILYREKDAKVRNILYKATERAVDAFGYKAVMLQKDDDIIINIAVRKKYLV